MFDLERQLLCFVLHESLFLPALQTSLYHRAPSGADNSVNNKLLLGPTAEEEEGRNSAEKASSGQAVSAQGLATSDAAPAPSESSQLLQLSPSGTVQEVAATVAPPTTASSSTGGKERGGGAEREEDAEKSGVAAGGGTGVDAADSAEAGGLLSVAEQDVHADAAAAWPPCGTWCIPGEGAGTGSGPGGSGCNADAPEEPSALGAPSGIMSLPGDGSGPASGDSATGGKGAGRIGVEAAAEGGAQAAARAAAVGVIKWNGGEEGAVTDTMALLDCSLRR